MDEQTWFACEDPHAMLDAVRSHRRLSDRRWRLFGTKCCDRLSHLNLARMSVSALRVSEHYADGLAEVVELNRAYAQAFDVATEYQQLDGPPVAAGFAALATCYAAHPDESADDVAHYARRALASETEASYQADLLRDIFGNPFRPVTIDASWLTSDVLALARGIYDERAFDRMPILADALQDAGCNNDDVLRHCRGGNAHVRGCWVVDSLLGKA